MDREAWRAAIHRVAKSRTQLSDWTELNWALPSIQPLPVAVLTGLRESLCLNRTSLPNDTCQSNSVCPSSYMHPWTHIPASAVSWEEGSQAQGRWQMCPRPTGCLKKGHPVPLMGDPVHLPHIIGDHAEFHGEGTGFKSADLGSNSSSILFTKHLSLVSPNPHSPHLQNGENTAWLVGQCEEKMSWYRENQLGWSLLLGRCSTNVGFILLPFLIAKPLMQTIFKHNI